MRMRATWPRFYQRRDLALAANPRLVRLSLRGARLRKPAPLSAGCGGITGVTPLVRYRDWIVQTATKLGATAE